MLEPYECNGIKGVGYTLLIVSIMGVFRGYFQGTWNMMPTAISQIIEQIFVLIASIAGAYVLYHRGEK